MMETFRIGQRFLKIKYLCVIVNSFVVVVFYFIYHYLLGKFSPDFVNAPLALIFLVIGLLVAKITLWFADKYASGIFYQVMPEGLVITQGHSIQTYTWDSFTAAKFRPYRFREVFPVEFQADGKTLILNQYIEGLCQLTGLILDQIQDYAEIDPIVRQRSKDLLDVY